MSDPGPDGVATAAPTRYRCDGCGNLTSFDVTVARRVREFQHFTVGGELEVESTEVLESEVQEVQCRWCGASGDRIEVVTDPAAGSPSAATRSEEHTSELQSQR